jgi:hypothetical protein
MRLQPSFLRFVYFHSQDAVFLLPQHRKYPSRSSFQWTEHLIASTDDKVIGKSALGVLHTELKECAERTNTTHI